RRSPASPLRPYPTLFRSADASGPAVPVVYACQVLPVGAEVEAACLPSGGGDFDAPCLSGRDCAPGFACVGESHAGLCRPYCCERTEEHTSELQSREKLVC